MIEGTRRADDLPGTNRGDNITGLAGNDDLYGRSGSDRLFGGGGRDTLDGGAGDDLVNGGSGNDVVIVSAGEDDLRGGGGSDTLDASAWTAGVWLNLEERDLIDFTPGYTDSNVTIPALSMKLRDAGPNADWTVQSVSGFESFIGSPARDWVELAFGSRADKVLLGGGDDTFRGSEVRKVTGGAGNDAITISYGQALGGAGDDRLTGGSQDGDTRLIGGRGNDTLNVSGNTIAKGGAGADILVFQDSDRDNRVFGGAGADVFRFLGVNGAGVMQDFVPGVDRIDLTGYTSADPSITWESLQGMFEAGETGVRIRLLSDGFSNILFEFRGLERENLSEADFIL
jgi:Ca2+-binding RTX toxin-like protein